MQKALFGAGNLHAVIVLVGSVGAAPPPLPTIRPVSPPRFIFVAPDSTVQQNIPVRSCLGSKTYYVASEDVTVLKNTVPTPRLVFSKGPNSTIMTATKSAQEISGYCFN
jgi:hypothetical protein